MNPELMITMAWERLEEGTAEERACFGLLGIQQGNACLTEGIDGFIDRSRSGPLVSGYLLAEWLTWNWWRLTVEPKPYYPQDDWAFAHRLSTIGAGYIWPNLTIYSDRERTILIAKPTHPQNFAAFRYIADQALILPTQAFVASVDRFIGQIQGQLRAESIPETNLDRIWAEVCAERADSAIAYYRRIEALLGADPDEGDPAQIQQLLADANCLGLEAIQEIAADRVPGQRTPTADELIALAQTRGHEIRQGEMAPCDANPLPAHHQVPAWQRGYQAADMLRKQQRLGQEPLTNLRLAELCGVSDTSLQASTEGAAFAFSLNDESGNAGRIVLRSKNEQGRRFELARLLGDRIAGGFDDRLSPATRSYTYRQKLQRAFAAELLCPFQSLEAKLCGDYSPEAQEDAAYHFNVSERVVKTLLINHHRLERDLLEDDAWESALAA